LFSSLRVKNRKKTRSPIPTFKSVEDEAAFWDTHSSEEFANELVPVECVKFVKARLKYTPTSKSRKAEIDQG